MKNIKLIKPSFNDLWFRSQCLSDPKTMNYNAGYDVEYAGYDYNTGCIEFNKDKWQNGLTKNLATQIFTMLT